MKRTGIFGQLMKLYADTTTEILKPSIENSNKGISIEMTNELLSVMSQNKVRSLISDNHS